MKCRTVRKMMDEYAYGMLGPRTERRIRAHLAACAACAEGLADTRAVHDALPSWPEVPLPEDGYHRLSSRLEFAPPPAVVLRPRRFRHLVLPYVAGLATAACVMFLAGGTFPDPAGTEDGPAPLAAGSGPLPGESVLREIGAPIRFVSADGQLVEIEEDTWNLLDESVRRRILPGYRMVPDSGIRAHAVDYETR